MVTGELNGEVANQDAAAERCVVGGVLLEPAALPRVKSLVAPADFHDGKLALIYEVQIALADRGEPIDVVTVGHELRARERLNVVGGPQFLGALTDDVPTTAHLERYAALVRDLAQVRRAIALGKELAGFERTRVDLAAVAGLEARLRAVAQPRTTGDLVPIGPALERVFEDLESRALRGGLAGLRCGFADIDRLLGGFRPGKLYVLAARPAVGKSALAGNITRFLARQGAVAFFSLEMPREELVDRLLCAEASVDSTAFREGRLTARDADALTKAAERLYQLPILIDDTPGQRCAQIEAKAERARAQHGLVAIVIDYLQLVHGDVAAESREKEVSAVARWAKDVSKRLGLPVIALAQLNRAIEKRGKGNKESEPENSDLRESGEIENAADIIGFLMRREQEARVVFTKHRGGATGVVPLFYHAAYTRFASVQRAPGSEDGWAA